MNRRGRLRELITAGLIDSFGLSLGWTLFNLLAVARGGLAMAAVYNVAMLVGVMASAPVTGWLAGRMHGRALVTVTAGVEVVLRVGTLVALLRGWPVPVIVAGVVVLNLAAWAGFAAMRAEVAAVDGRPVAMTRYAMGIAVVEAVGAAVAALVPLGSHGTVDRVVLVAVVTAYGASLLPTLCSARRARVRRAPRGAAAPPRVPVGRATPNRGTSQVPAPVGALIGGALIMLVASGPTYLAVAFAAELHGPTSVAGAAAAFSAGCLLSSFAVGLVGRQRLPATLGWPLWGVGMLVGWVLAPWHVAGLLVAQFLSGLSLTAFEGAMDARAARQAGPGKVTSALACSAATRALGSAVAVRLLPVLVSAPAIGLLSGAAAAVLALAGVLSWTVAEAYRARTRPRHLATTRGLLAGIRP